MKTRKIASVSLGLLMILGSAPAAFAGSASVSNSWNIRKIKDGYSELNVHVQDNYYYNRDAYASAWKESHGYTVVKDDLDGGKGGDPCGKGKCAKPPKKGDDGTKFAEFEVFWAGSDSYASEYGHGDTHTTVNLFEKYHFTGFEKTHTVGSDFSY